MHRQDSYGHSSLVAASLVSHVDVVIMLLENDAQVDLQGNHGQSSWLLVTVVMLT